MEKIFVFIFLIFIKLNINAQANDEVYIYTMKPGFDVYLLKYSVQIINEKEKEYSFMTHSYINKNYVDSCKADLKQIKGMKLDKFKYSEIRWYIKCIENKLALFSSSYYDTKNRLIKDKYKVIPKEIPYQDPNDGKPAKALYDFFCSYIATHHYKNSIKIE